MATTGEIEVRLDPRLLGQFLREVRGFSPELAKTTRKRLREAAVPAVNDVKKRLMGRTFKTDTGLAAGLAAGTKLSIRTGAADGRDLHHHHRREAAGRQAGDGARVRQADDQASGVRPPGVGDPEGPAVLRGRARAQAGGDAPRRELAVTDALATVRTGAR
jgi:hypothetical protein